MASVAGVARRAFRDAPRPLPCSCAASSIFPQHRHRIASPSPRLITSCSCGWCSNRTHRQHHNVHQPLTAQLIVVDRRRAHCCAAVRSSLPSSPRSLSRA